MAFAFAVALLRGLGAGFSLGSALTLHEAGVGKSRALTFSGTSAEIFVASLSYCTKAFAAAAWPSGLRLIG